MSPTTIYKVRVSNGDYSPSWPYQGTDKDIAIAVATAYIQRGKRVTILEAEGEYAEKGEVK
jgi:hypothetical protein